MALGEPLGFDSTNHGFAKFTEAKLSGDNQSSPSQGSGWYGDDFSFQNLERWIPGARVTPLP